MISAPGLIRVEETSRERWQAIAAGAEHATWFHTWDWADFWDRETGNARPKGFLFVFEDGVEALVPATVHVGRAGLTRVHTSSATGKYGGWLSLSQLTAGHVGHIAGYLTKLDITIRQNPFAPHGDSMPWTRQDFTQVIDLTPGIEAVRAGWSKNHRWSLAQAVKKGVIVEAAEGLPAWREYDALYRDSLRRWGDAAQSVVPWSVFERLATSASPSIRLRLARHEGRAVAGAVCFAHRDHVVYWHGAALEEAFDTHPVHAVIERLLHEACEGGFRWFDFNPSGGLEGVVRFKEWFGCVRLPANVFEGARPLRRIVSRLTRIAGRKR